MSFFVGRVVFFYKVGKTLNSLLQIRSSQKRSTGIPGKWPLFPFQGDTELCGAEERGALTREAAAAVPPLAGAVGLAPAAGQNAASAALLSPAQPADSSRIASGGIFLNC